MDYAKTIYMRSKPVTTTVKLPYDLSAGLKAKAKAAQHRPRRSLQAVLIEAIEMYLANPYKAPAVEHCLAPTPAPTPALTLDQAAVVQAVSDQVDYATCSAYLVDATPKTVEKAAMYMAYTLIRTFNNNACPYYGGAAVARKFPKPEADEYGDFIPYLPEVLERIKLHIDNSISDCIEKEKSRLEKREREARIELICAQDALKRAEAFWLTAASLSNQP